MDQKIKVTVDKRTELLYVILSLSDYAEINSDLMIDNENYPYKYEVDNYFAKFKNHKVVSLVNEAMKRVYFKYTTPVHLFLQLDDEYNFHGQDKYPFVGLFNKSQIILDLVKEAKNFAKESKFDEFYNAHLDLYNSIISATENYVKNKNILPWVKEFYKAELPEQTFSINHLLLGKNVGYGISQDDWAVCCDGVRCWDEGINFKPNFGVKHFTAHAYHYLHEYLHSIVNPLTDMFFEEVCNFDFSLVNEDLKLKGYSNRSAFVNDSVIRAIEPVYMKDSGYSEESIEDYIKDVESQGFICTRELYAKLLEYQNKKDTNFEKEFVDIASVNKNHFSK